MSSFLPFLSQAPALPMRPLTHLPLPPSSFESLSFPPPRFFSLSLVLDCFFFLFVCGPQERVRSFSLPPQPSAELACALQKTVVPFFLAAGWPRLLPPLFPPPLFFSKQARVLVFPFFFLVACCFGSIAHSSLLPPFSKKSSTLSFFPWFCGGD